MIVGKNGTCDGCGKQSWLIPLHGERGGPLRCYLCVGEWNAKYTRRRKWGRIIIKAMKMFEKEGGNWSDFDKLKIASLDWGDVAGIPNYEADLIGAEVGDITSELLDDLLQLTHPDRHPPERKQFSQRVTQELLALKPFVFPAPKPVQPSRSKSRDRSIKDPAATLQKPSPTYPCELCVDEVPHFYCNSCKAEWTKRQEEEHKREREKRRRWYARRQQSLKAGRSRKRCLVCSAIIKDRRNDTKYCSAACRQRHYRRRDVTAQSTSEAKLDASVTPKQSRNVWKLEERGGQLWHGNMQITNGGDQGDWPSGSIGWHHGSWKPDYSAIRRLWRSRQTFFDPIHRCWDCDGWILAHPNTARCNDCKAIHDAKDFNKAAHRQDRQADIVADQPLAGLFIDCPPDLSEDEGP